MSLYGNCIDLLVRNAQGGQTVGLPVGPDTSRLIAEIVATGIDKAIETTLKRKRSWSATQRGAMRFVADFTFGCASRHEAEVVVAAIRRCAEHIILEVSSR